MVAIRQLGEGTTPNELDLEAVVRRVPDWQGRAVRYRMLVGGINNNNWVVDVEGHGRRYFVKVPGKGTEIFINRRAANEAARNAHAIGIAPEVVFFDEADGTEIAEFLEGYRACTNGDFQRREVQLGMLDLYRRFHGGPQLSLTKTIFDMIEEHFRQAEELKAHLPPDFEWLRNRYLEAKAAILASGLDLVPCFNDPMPGNFLIGEGKPMRLIDYEFASNNERAYELGVVFGEMFYEEQVQLELIEAYYGAVRADAVARVYICRALADIKWAGWAIVNRKLSPWDFDYQKYGDWKNMRARDLLYDPRWPAWLKAV